MKYTIKRTIIAGAAITLMLSPALVSAKDGSGIAGAEPSPSTSASPTPEPSETPRPERVRELQTNLQEQLQRMKTQRQATTGAETETEKAELHQKLDDSKKKICEDHVSQINTIISNMSKRRQNSFDQITKVATAVESFYVTKKLSVSNYTDLVAAVDAAKAVAQTALTAQQSAPQLVCTSDHPRSDVADFKEKRASSIDAMKAYRNAVKALVKAVKTAAVAAETTPSPTPTTGGNN